LMWPFVLAVLYRQLRGARDLAEDAAQEVFLRLVRYAPFENLQDASAFRAYLATVCRNVARTYLRQALGHGIAGKFGESPESGLPEPAEKSTPEAEVDLNDMLAHVLTRVDPPDRSLAELLLKGFTLPEIVQKTGMGYNLIAVRLHRLRKKLRK